jgi:hypothetical protein
MPLWRGEAPEEPTALPKLPVSTNLKTFFRLKVRRAVVYRSAAARRVFMPNKSAVG